MSMRFRTAQIVLRAADFALTQTHYAAAFTKTLTFIFSLLTTHVPSVCSRRQYERVSHGLAANSVLSYLAGYEAARGRANAKSSQKHKKIGVRLSCGNTASRTPTEGMELKDAWSRGTLRSGAS